MGRILAIDYGSKRSGIAVTDPLQLITTPLEGIPTHTLIDYLTSYFEQEDVELVVVGYPLMDDGSPTNNTPLVEAFVNRFRKVFPDMPLDLHDEWNTSNMAMQTLIKSGVRKKKRRDKHAIDMVSAAIILESYIEAKK